MYKIGQKVRLWSFVIRPGTIQVMRDVMVTITEEKTGVPGNHSETPSQHQSLKARAEDGTEFEKHWDSWPESQTDDFEAQWSLHRSRGEFWYPHESIYVYDMITRTSQRFRLVDAQGKDIRPSGDNIVYCKEHDCYSYGEDASKDCYKCHARAHDVALAVSQT